MGQILCPYWGESVTVNGTRYDVVKSIGEGAFSYVQLVRKGAHQYALKRVLIQVPEHEQMIEREVKSHQAVQNRYVMPLVEYEITAKGTHKEARILFPYHELGSVQEMVEVAKIMKHPIPEKDILLIFKSLCEAVTAFHKHNPALAHRDIKPHNMLIGENSTCVLMDLGSCREARVEINSRQEALAFQEMCAQDCTAAYRAPELFEVPSECFITEKTDVWSLGCTLYALAYGDSPCDGTALSAVSPQIKTDDNLYSAAFNQLIQEILIVDPESRPETVSIMKTVDKLLSKLK